MEERNKTSVSKKIKELRLEHNMTQEDLAKRLGISRGCMANYETGKRRPDALMLRKLAFLLGVSSDFLLGMAPARSFTLNEKEEFGDFAAACEQVTEYGDILRLDEVDRVSRVEIIDYYEYLKNHPRKQRYFLSPTDEKTEKK